METPASRHRTRIKVCGITRRQDALLAAELGADAVGFVFYDKSPRYLAPEKAAAIVRALPPFVSAVGLFVNPTQDQIDAALTHCPLDVLQLHGDESPEFCEAQHRRVVKAVPVSGPADLKRAHRFDCPVLLDARAPDGVYGGTGIRFDWGLLDGFAHAWPLVLAGGLDAQNVAAALAVRQWFALDVSSGVEALPGIKDEGKMRAFFAAVHKAEERE
ncbi:MAG TPA: phosphoribosylanthranilate isomerase [Mariprofundaceae bacterium]|nr:phosphoribosylanthranilate isomerase [Mariprofundaceae bacterium]